MYKGVLSDLDYLSTLLTIVIALLEALCSQEEPPNVPSFVKDWKMKECPSPSTNHLRFLSSYSCSVGICQIKHTAAELSLVSLVLDFVR